MANVLAIGVATFDWIQVVDVFPRIDDEVRAEQQMLLRGGNATNTLMILNQLGHECSWLGSLADDIFSDLICADLEKNKIDYSLCPKIKNSVSPTSHILLSQATASRNIVHSRCLRELIESDSRDIDFSQWDWIHFEGRNIVDTLRLMQQLKQQQPSIIISLEIEKPRQDIETLFEYADHCLFSRHYAHSQGYDSAKNFLQDIQTSTKVTQDIVCAWGEQGAMAVSKQGEYIEAPALNIKVVDTRAAGDVFNAAYISAAINGDDLSQRLEKACYLAGTKSAQMGIE